MFVLRPRRQFGQWELALDIAKFAVPTIGSFATTWYQGTVSKDIAATQAEAMTQSAEIQAAAKQYEIEKLLGLQTSPTAQGSTLSTQVAGFPMWAIALIAGMGVFMLTRKRR